MKRHRRVTCSAATAFTLFAGSLVQASAAQATGQDPVLQLSGDGLVYAETLSQPVVRSTGPIIPGGAIEGSVSLRNGSPDDALLSVAALAGIVDPALAQELTVRATRADWSGKPQPLGGVGHCTDLAVGLPVPAGESVRLTIAVELAVDAPSATRQASADFALRFLLRDSNGGEVPGACSDPRGVIVPGTSAYPPTGDATAGVPQGNLADTGAMASPWIIAGGGVLAVGALLVGLARHWETTRRRAEKEDLQ